MTVTIGDGLANDGEAGEGDLVPDDIGRVLGGEAGDSLSVTSHAEFDPQLKGRGGNDTIVCTRPFATLFGGSGDDSVTGTGADIAALGGPGDDMLIGGRGNFQVFGGGPGDDHINVSAGTTSPRQRGVRRPYRR